MKARTKTQEMTLFQYMESEQNTDNLAYPSITKRIRENKSLPNVKGYKKFARTYVLDVVKKEIYKNS